MKKSTQINPVPAIPRSLSESPDYQPDWRHETAQKYLVDIGKATDPSQKLAQIWKAEPDVFVLQLLLFHCGGPCLIRPEINYAVSCWKNGFKTGIAGQIKALIAANVESKEIASLIGTDRFNVDAFELLFFDVRYCPGKAFLLRAICSRATDPGASAESQIEARLIQIGINQGKEAVLTAIFGKHVSNPHKTKLECSVECGIKSVVARASDYLNSLDTSGRAVSKEDLELIPSLSELKDICQKLSRENPPGPQQRLNGVVLENAPLDKLLDLANSVAKSDLFVNECLLHPSRSHLEEFLKLPVFRRRRKRKEPDMVELAKELRSTLKQAFPIWESQLATANSRWTDALLKELAIMAEAEGKNDPSISSASQSVTGKILWSKVFKEVTSQ